LAGEQRLVEQVPVVCLARATIADSGLVVEADRVKWDLPANVIHTLR
jgi:hypothetical protein